LYELDDKEIKIDGDLTEKYMEIRKEIVAVVQDINMTTDTVAEMIKKINSYKKQIYANTKSLNETRS
jgi:methyl-accepting chemotaxis protein